MLPLLQALIDLTEVDHQLVTTREQLARYGPMLERMQAEEARAEARVSAELEHIEAMRGDRRRIEAEVATLREQAARYRAQQNQVKSNKEYQAILSEIESLEGRIDTLETEGLEKLEAEEQARGAIDRLRVEQTEVADRNATERARIEAQVREKRERLDRLESERARRAAELDDEALENYELIHKKHPGSACAPVEGNHCGGCGRHLVAHVIQDVRKGEQLVHCEDCRRYLHMP